MNCPACGRDVTGKKFCPICGRPVEQPEPVSAQAPEQDYVPQSAQEVKADTTPRCEPIQKNDTRIKPDQNPFNTPTRQVAQKSSKTSVMVVICIVLALAIVIAGVLLFMSVYNSGGEDAPQGVAETEAVTNKPDEQNENTQPEFPRNSTYSSGYTYNNMQEIHSSKEAEDKEAFEMQDVVTSFNNSWVEYVNSGDTSVFSYLRADTQAYKYAVAYGAKDIHEEYILMEVNDVRKYGDSYYVWTHEIIEEASTVDSTDVKRFEYHWVYKVSYSDGGYYIENYISDPAYK